MTESEALKELLNILTAIHNENSVIYELLISSYIDENTTFYGSKREEIIREKMKLFNEQFDNAKLEILNSLRGDE